MEEILFDETSLNATDFTSGSELGIEKHLKDFNYISGIFYNNNYKKSDLKTNDHS